MINFKHLLIIINKFQMTLGAKSAEVFLPAQTHASQDSSTPSDRARQDAVRVLKSHEICRREGPQTGLARFIIKS